MSITSSPDCLFRPEDKALKMLFPSIEDPVPNAFDDFLDAGLYHYSDSDDNKDIFKDHNFFDSDTVDPWTGGTSSLGASTQEQSSSQPWRKGLWCLSQARGSASEIVVQKRRNAERPTPVSAHNIGNIGSHQPFYRKLRSPPLTPAHCVQSPSTSTARATWQAQCRRPDSLREATLSPSPMYSSLQSNQATHFEPWQRDFQNFHLHQPVFPPLSGNGFHQYTCANELNAAHVAHNGAAMQYPRANRQIGITQPYQLQNNQVMPVEVDLLGSMPASSNAQMANERNQQRYVVNGEYGHPHHSKDAEWTLEEFDSSSGSQYSQETAVHQPATSTAPGYWFLRDPSQMQPTATSQTCYAEQIAATTPQGVTHHLVSSIPEQHNGGLGIHYSDIETPVAATTPATFHNQLAAYPALPPACPPGFLQIDPFSTPRRSQRQRSPSRPPSPSVSPTNPRRTSRHRSPTRSATDHHRRKSIHKSGPIRDKDRDSSKPPRTPTTPSTANAFDFVNLTPRDSAKLLSDVAPSGSSKTRARREAEARDRRKRLSEAALRAVRSAGGDVAAIEKDILV